MDSTCEIEKPEMWRTLHVELKKQEKAKKNEKKK